MSGDIRKLDLNLLKAFAALLETCSVTRAAEILALTQPAVSSMLARLRENFDDPLFVRSQRGMVPTPRALALAPQLARVLSDIEAMLQPQDFDPASSEMQLTIAATDYALRAVVVPFLARLRQLAPGIRVRVRPVDDAQLSAQLARGEVDLALVTPESTPSELHARALFDEHYLCLMRQDHPAAMEGALTLSAFCALDQALVSYQGEDFNGVTDRALAQLGLKRKVTLSVTSFLILPEILRVSDLVAVVPARLSAQLEGLTTRTPPLTIPGFTKSVAWHERTHRAIAHRWLRQQLFTLFAEQDGQA